MVSGGAAGLSELAIAEQTDILEHRIGAGGELVQEGGDALAQGVPVSGESVLLEHVLLEPAPEFLNGIEPGSVGRQPDGLQSGQGVERGQHVGMGVDGPVVLDQIDVPSISVPLIELAVERADLLASDDVVVAQVHLAGQRVERPDHAPELLLAAGPLGQRARRRGHQAPIGRRFRPARVAHLIQEACHDLVRGCGGLAQAGQQPRFFGEVGGIGAVLLDLGRAQPPDPAGAGPGLPR